MEFEFTASIYISDEDLHQMYLRVKTGESFLAVYEEIMAFRDDFDFYSRNFIRDQVKEEINRRLAQTQENS